MNEYEAKFRKVVKGRAVVYIDAANLEQSVKGMFVRPDDVPEELKHLQVDIFASQPKSKEPRAKPGTPQLMSFGTTARCI